jgi:hypothetical protein
VTFRRGGSPRSDDRTRSYAPSQAELRDPVERARAARELRTGGKGSGGRGIAAFAGILVIIGAVVLGGFLVFTTILRPAVAGWVTGMAYDSPSLLGIGWVSDLVRDDLGAVLTDKASTDSAEVEFTVEHGDTAAGIVSPPRVCSRTRGRSSSSRRARGSRASSRPGRSCSART